jgi:predicted acylesterase/phospholipase RssA
VQREQVLLLQREIGEPPIAALEATAQLLSPYQLNPLDINPLRDLLEHLVDFERLRRDRSLKLFIAATTLRTGSLRIFENRELSADAVLASACLPWLHQAVEIEGEPYWDGGYVSNPPLLPLVERCRARDLLLVRINSSERSALPKSAGEIATGWARSCSTSRSSGSSPCSRRDADRSRPSAPPSGGLPAIACT